MRTGPTRSDIEHRKALDRVSKSRDNYKRKCEAFRKRVTGTTISRNDYLARYLKAVERVKELEAKQSLDEREFCALADMAYEKYGVGWWTAKRDSIRAATHLANGPHDHDHLEEE